MSDLIELTDKTLIDLLLEEQQEIDTPVGRLAESAKQAEARSAGTGAQSYQSLIPLSAPGLGQQLAFEVNLDKCSGCKGCVTACHSLNGLDENETWRDAGLLVGGTVAHPFQQTVTTACHHCVEPACLIGCPVKAYEKDPVSGIVMHLDDQCIGCQYCVLKCPYDVPKYSESRGIVRKCDMCQSRLSVGEAPACVQACPHEAIAIVTVEKSESEAAAAAGEFLPGAPEPSYTVPTTRYVSKNPLPSELEAGDANALRPQPLHGPLVAMLTLSQFGVGGFLAAAFFGEAASLSLLGASWLLLHVGLAASVLHLGQPLKAWRIFLGLRTSWLSREAVVFGVCSPIATATVLAGVYEVWIRETIFATLALGLIGVLTSVFIYSDTRRSFWRFPYAAARFFGSVLAGGLALAACFQVDATASLGLLAVGVAKLGSELVAMRENETTRRLLAGPLSRLWIARLVSGVVGYVVLPILLVLSPSLALAVATLLAVMGGEVLERALFFRAVNAAKMPGGLSL